MREFTKKYVEQFVNDINSKVEFRISRLEGNAIAYALNELLEELEDPILCKWWHSTIPTLINNNWQEGDYDFNFKLSDNDLSCQREVKKIFDFARNVCELIKYNDVYYVFFNSFALVCEWLEPLSINWPAPPPPHMKLEEKDGDF